MVTIEKVSLSLEERPVLVDVSWTVYDELSLLTQVKLAQLQDVRPEQA